jgi:hypothetical protein
MVTLALKVAPASTVLGAVMPTHEALSDAEVPVRVNGMVVAGTLRVKVVPLSNKNF